jgi:hypothetical protein
MRRTALPLLLLVAVSCAGCAGGREASARAAAEAFSTALAGSDTATACSLLAPATRQQVESDAKAPCDQAVAQELQQGDLQPGGAARSATAYDGEAQVREAADTVFLSRFGSAWRVVAAGCEAQPGQPYECEVQGQ